MMYFNIRFFGKKKIITKICTYKGCRVGQTCIIDIKIHIKIQKYHRAYYQICYILKQFYIINHNNTINIIIFILFSYIHFFIPLYLYIFVLRRRNKMALRTTFYFFYEVQGYKSSLV